MSSILELICDSFLNFLEYYCDRFSNMCTEQNSLNYDDDNNDGIYVDNTQKKCEDIIVSVVDITPNIPPELKKIQEYQSQEKFEIITIYHT